jgi:transcriptional regulator with XRE-family HTH domain
MNKEALLELANICREKQKEKNVSLQTLFDITKIQISIIEKLLNDEEYVINNFPYSKFLLLQIAKALDIDVDEFQKKLSLTDDPKTGGNVDFKKVKKVINSSVTIVLTISTMIYAYSLDGRNNIENNILKYLQKEKASKEDKAAEKYALLNKSADSLSKIEENKIVLVASGDVWLTAYIDGFERVIKLKKGESKTITFFHKIKIETLGNPSNLTVKFKGKSVKFNSAKKILHNIFIDHEGIFINGYNKLAEN